MEGKKGSMEVGGGGKLAVGINVLYSYVEKELVSASRKKRVTWVRGIRGKDGQTGRKKGGEVITGGFRKKGACLGRAPSKTGMLRIGGEENSSIGTGVHPQNCGESKDRGMIGRRVKGVGTFGFGGDT